MCDHQSRLHRCQSPILAASSSSNRAARNKMRIYWHLVVTGRSRWCWLCGIPRSPDVLTDWWSAAFLHIPVVLRFRRVPPAGKRALPSKPARFTQAADLPRVTLFARLGNEKRASGRPPNGRRSQPGVADSFRRKQSTMKTRTHLMSRQFDVVIERDAEGYYVASVPQLPGCHTQGRSLDEINERIREAIELCLEVEGAPDQDLEFVGIQRPLDLEAQ